MVLGQCFVLVMTSMRTRLYISLPRISSLANGQSKHVFHAGGDVFEQKAYISNSSAQYARLSRTEYNSPLFAGENMIENLYAVGYCTFCPYETSSRGRDVSSGIELLKRPIIPESLLIFCNIQRTFPVLIN